MSVADYARVSQLRVEWTLDTVIPPKPVATKSAEASEGDHCAPNLSKAERLKRLSKHGSVRDKGLNKYEVGNRGVWFRAYGDSLIDRY